MTPPAAAGDPKERHERGAEVELLVEGFRLRAHRGDPPPTSAVGSRPALVLCHDFPTAHRPAPSVFLTYPELAERVAWDTGSITLALAFRGCGGSEGDASAEGWVADLRAAVAHLRADPSVDRVALAGFGVGAGVALLVAEADPAIVGVAALACPADLDSWASDPRRMLEHCRALGAVSTPGFPGDVTAWARQLAAARAVDHVAGMGERPFLVVHGVDDETTPVLDARALADAAQDAGGDPELRLLAGASHDLRNDPRAVAILMGWLDRLT